MITPVLSDEAFLRDVSACGQAVLGAPAAAPPERFCLWWLGQSGFLLQWRGRHLLLDPYLSDSLTEKYAETDRPHVRMTERVVAPEALGFVDAVTCSHQHTDHLDAATIGPILERRLALPLVVPEAIRGFAADRLGVPPERLTGVDDGQEVEAGGFRLTAIPSAHEDVERDAQGRCRYLGYVVRFGRWSVYHSGDTVRYPGLEERLRAQRVDVAILPINGARPERRVPGNLDGPEAAALAHAAGVGLVIPCHFEMFTFNTASPDGFRAAAERLGQPYRVLRAGERWCSDEEAGAAWA